MSDKLLRSKHNIQTPLFLIEKHDVPPPDQNHRPWHISWVDPSRRFFFSQWSCLWCFSKPRFWKVTIFSDGSCPVFFANLIEIEAISCLFVLFFVNLKEMWGLLFFRWKNVRPYLKKKMCGLSFVQNKIVQNLCFRENPKVQLKSSNSVEKWFSGGRFLSKSCTQKMKNRYIYIYIYILYIYIYPIYTPYILEFLYI